MQQKKKQARPNPGDRSGDRFMHNLMSMQIAGAENMKRDACVDVGSQQFGSSHRSQFPHRNLGEMTAYMCWRDFVDGRKPDPVLNAKLAAGNIIIDRLPSKLKEKMKLVQQLQSVFG